ncbi:Uncharacterised protein [Serratia liquefaciens]|uniref:hypothetical protein n=1 Tax=Serratia liquefaciens TaxID=614 RepID=UPI00217B0E37|nr:hypothetical protein [Serratia liquefaciens]CAI1699726.1 Uncharacterised protein [Serratia liquefaciens]HDS8357452.1 hypothetical protein [Serratia liquefaciens]
MGVKRLVDDAIFMKSNSKFKSALSLSILALAASSSKMFNKKQQTLKAIVINSCKKCGFEFKPRNLMGDGEKFKLCFDIAAYKIVFGDEKAAGKAPNMVSIEYKGNYVSLADILYKHYRNALIHEGNLPSNIRLSAATPVYDSKLDILGAKLWIKDDTIILSHEWIDLLCKMSVSLDCNAAEYGRVITKIKVKKTVNEKLFYADAITKFGATESRMVFVERFMLIDDNWAKDLNSISDDNVIELYKKAVLAGVLNGVSKGGLEIKGIIDRDGELCQKGIDLLKYASGNYEKITY